MPAIMTPPETRAKLREIQWDTYKRLIEDIGENRSPRLSFYHGDLEIMSPGYSHERSNEIIDKLVFVLCEETMRPIRGVGALTCIREDMKAGIQPDCCYYFESLSKLRKGEEVDLDIDPPPDLMIEIDITRSSMYKLPILLALGIPEWWQYDGEQLRIYALNGKAYEQQPRSRFFPSFDIAAAFPRFLQMKDDWDDVSVLRQFRQWVRESMKTQ